MTVSVLTIAGSDPGGGAGIQADLRVFGALNVAGLSAVTALTIQNSQEVRAVYVTPAEVLSDQIEALLQDATDLRAVKIGMLGGAPQVHAVAQLLRRFRPPHVVLDPVLASTGGVPLLDEAGRQALLDDLLPLCDLVTPNLAEAGVLAGTSASNEATAQAAGERLLGLGAKAVLVKGGHRAGAPNDWLLRPGQSPIDYAGSRVDTPHTHGTGCLLSAAIAARLALGDTLEAGIGEAKALLSRALLFPVIGGQGRGYPDVLAAGRAENVVPNDPRTHTDRIALVRGVYVLTDPDLRPDRDAEAIAQAALAGGATVVQLRDKRLATPDLIALAKRLNRMTKTANALFIVNDRVDVALAADADGVHLGPDDMPPEEARRLLGPRRLVGVSVGTLQEARLAAPWASYLGVGAIFGSSTKGDAGPPVGVARIREIGRAFPQLPLVAIGGIHSDNIAHVAQAGAAAAAVVSAVVGQPDMRQATRNLCAGFQDAPPV